MQALCQHVVDLVGLFASSFSISLGSHMLLHRQHPHEASHTDPSPHSSTRLNVCCGDLRALTSAAVQVAGAAGSSHCRAPSAIRFAMPADSCADRIERRAEKRLFWQLAPQPEFRCGSGFDYTRMAAAFNQEAADQTCAVYKGERPPPHEQDTLRFIDAQRLREFHEDVLSASAAAPASNIPAAETAPLPSSSPAPATYTPFERFAAQLLRGTIGGTASEPIMADGSAAEALAALQEIGIPDCLGVQSGTDAAQTLPQEGAQSCPPASVGVGIPPADAAAAAAAQAASRQAQRQADLMRCIQPATQQSGGLGLAAKDAAHGIAPLPLPQSSTAMIQQPPAPQSHANTVQQRKRVLLAVVAVLLANFSAMLGYQMTSRRALGHSPGARAVMANTAAMSGNLPMMAAAAGMLHTPAKNQGGADVAKRCRLCQQPRRGTHQHGCRSHCKDCKQPHAACSCDA